MTVMTRGQRQIVFEMQDDAMYMAYDRFVCSNPSCCGSTARSTGRTIDGHRLHELRVSEVVEWYRLLPKVKLTCECGRLEAVLIEGIATVLPTAIGG